MAHVKQCYSITDDDPKCCLEVHLTWLIEVRVINQNHALNADQNLQMIRINKQKFNNNGRRGKNGLKVTGVGQTCRSVEWAGSQDGPTSHFVVSICPKLT